MSYKTNFDRITFKDPGEYIEGDGTNLNVISSNLVNIQLGNTDASTKLSILNSDSSEVGYITDTGVIHGSNISTDSGADINALAQINTDKSDPQGFCDCSTISISFDDGTSTLTISDSGGSFSYYSESTKYTKTGDQTFEMGMEEGSHFIYYQNSTIAETTTFTIDLIKRYALIAFIYWDATNSKALYIGHEYRHGIIMDSRTHAYLHVVHGFALESGGQLGNILADENGSLDSHCQFSNGASICWDEDAKFEHGARLSTATIPVFYRTGLDESNIWRSDETRAFPIRNDATTGRATYNQLTGGSWQQTAVANNDFVLAHVAVTNDVDRPYVVFQGQADYLDLTSARAGADTEINSLITEGLPIVEFKFVATVIIQTGNIQGQNYSNTVQSRIVSTVDGADYIDLRGVVIGRIGTSSTVTDHNALSNVVLATTGITYGHIDDQAQIIYGIKTFINGLGAGTEAPGTLIQGSSETPYLTLKNTTDEHTAGGAESQIIFEDHSNTTLARIETSHEGTSDDTKGQFKIAIHNGTSLTDRLTIQSNGTFIFDGNVQVNGTTTTVDSQTMTVADPVITIGGTSAPTEDDNKDRGLEFRWFDTEARVGFFGFDDSTGFMTFIPQATNTDEVFTGNYGSFDVLRTYYRTTHTDGTNSYVSGNGTDLTLGGGDINLTATENINVPIDIGLTFGDDGENIVGDGTNLTINSSANLYLTAGASADVIIPVNIGLIFGDGAEKIESDNTNLTIASGGNIYLSATASNDVIIPVNIGLIFGDGSEKIESNNTDFTINSGGDINLTATADVNIPTNIGLTFGDDGEKIEGNGTDLTISSSNDINFITGGEYSLSMSGNETFIGLTTDIILLLQGGTDGSRGNIELSTNSINLDADGIQLRTTNLQTTYFQANSTGLKVPTSGQKLYFVDTGEYISGNGTDLTIGSGASINMATSGYVYVKKTAPANVFGNEARVSIYTTSGYGDAQGYLGSLCFGGYDTGIENNPDCAIISSNNENDFTTSNYSANLEFRTTAVGSTTPTLNFKIDYDGSIVVPNSDQKLYFVDTDEYISGDGTDLTIGSGGEIVLNCSSGDRLIVNGTKTNVIDDLEVGGNATITGNLTVGGSSIYGLPIGSIISYTTNTPPAGYLICDGSAVSRTTYIQLFSVIGTTYGAGDGSTTFNIPDIQGKTVVGKDTTDNDFNTMGETGGEKTHTLTTAELPSHNHSISDSGHRHLVPNLTQYVNGRVGTVGSLYKNDGQINTEYTSTTTTGITINSTGSGSSHNNLQPYITLNYCIKYSDVVVHSIIDDLETLHWDETEAELNVVIGETDIMKFSTTDITATMPVKIENNKGLCIAKSSAQNATIAEHNSIQLGSTTHFGGTYDEHTGVCLYSQMDGAWGTSDFRIKTSSNWATYESTETALIVSNDLTTVRKDCLIGGDLSIGGDLNMTGGTINYTSDRRAKKYIITTSSQDDFNVLKSIEIHKYKYIDELRRGTTEIHGVIAQELNEVYSEAITLTTDFIPNVYKYVKVIENNIVENYILCQLYEQSDLTIVLNVGDVLQIIDYYGRSVNCSIMEVIAETDTKPTQIKLISKGFNQRHFTDAQMDKVFIFGTQVTDYHKVIKERLIPLTISAVQYLANKVETMETSTNEHTNDVTVHKQTIGFSVDSSGEVISEENGNVEVEHMGTGVYKIIYTNYYLSYVPTIHVMPRIGMFGVFYTVQQREITNEYCIVDVGKFDDGGFSSGDCGLSIVVII